MVEWLKTLANHTYSHTGMNRPMDSNYKGTKGQFPPITKDDAIETTNKISEEPTDVLDENNETIEGVK